MVVGRWIFISQLDQIAIRVSINHILCSCITHYRNLNRAKVEFILGSLSAGADKARPTAREEWGTNSDAASRRVPTVKPESGRTWFHRRGP